MRIFLSSNHLGVNRTGLFGKVTNQEGIENSKLKMMELTTLSHENLLATEPQQHQRWDMALYISRSSTGCTYLLSTIQWRKS